MPDNTPEHGLKFDQECEDLIAFKCREALEPEIEDNKTTGTSPGKFCQQQALIAKGNFERRENSRRFIAWMAIFILSCLFWCLALFGLYQVFF